MTLKWNWGTGIMLVYIGFVVFMLGMVYLCTQQDYDLVTPDYYQQELKYQQVIDGMNNAVALDKAMTVSVDDKSVNVTLPMELIDASGELKIYRPDNASLDFNTPLPTNGKLSLEREKFSSGMYKVKATWAHNGKPYYSEESLFIP